ncbi:MAG TPA: hypothetical protein VHP83_19180 [Aggregatilineaceae bacterium]|nr:hypothetical protein [Aggregatilineaceae bacterium]
MSEKNDRLESDEIASEAKSAAGPEAETSPGPTRDAVTVPPLPPTASDDPTPPSGALPPTPSSAPPPSPFGPPPTQQPSFGAPAYEPTQKQTKKRGRKLPKVSAPKVNMPKVSMPDVSLDVNTAELGRRAQVELDRAGINSDIAAKVLFIALVTGLFAGLFSLLSADHVLLFGGLIAAVNGITYAIFKREEDLAGLIVAMIAGMTAILFWFIMTAIVDRLDAANLNLFQTLFVGLTFGGLGFSWIALLDFLRERFVSKG